MKCSIIKINYNNLDCLEKTIQSVFNHTCHNFEYIIIDGVAMDGSVADENDWQMMKSALEYSAQFDIVHIIQKWNRIMEGITHG